MAELGLEPQVHRDQAFAVEQIAGRTIMAGGLVENLLGVLPGRDRTAPALALVAHYDSVAGSPGAADDAAGVAAILETVRAIRARGAPARDVMVLITDGEEAGLLGARSFFQRDPMRGRIGFVMNLEARGSAGRVLMFQTGAGNGETLELLRRSAQRPSSSSLMVFIYEHMPNDTDFNVVRAAGLPGLNYAFIGRQFDYHSATSIPATLNRGTLQDLGDQVLSTAAAAAFAPTLPAPAPDAVYGQVFGDIIWAYPPTVGWLVLALAAGLIGIGAWQARRAGALLWIDVARGAGAALFALVGSAAVLNAARRLTGAGFGLTDQRWLLAQTHRWEVALLLLSLGFLLLAAATSARGRRAIGLVPLAAALASSAVGGLDTLSLALGAAAGLIAVLAFWRPTHRPGAWTGVLLAALAVAALVQALAPAAAYIFAWPLLLAGAGAALTAVSARGSRFCLIALAGVAAVGLGWLGPLAHLTYLGLDQPVLLALPLWIAAAVVWPLAQPEEGAPPSRLVGPILIVAGVAVLLFVRLDPPWDARTPQPSYVLYHMDQDAGRAWRLSDPAGRSAWADTALGTDTPQTRSHWAFPAALEAAPAPPIDQAAPAIALERLASGNLRLRAAPPPGARMMTIRLRTNTPVTVLAASGWATDTPLKPGAWTRLRWEGDPHGPVLVLKPAGPGGLEVRYAATIERWPAQAPPLPPRPDDLAPFMASDSTVVTGSRRFTW